MVAMALFTLQAGTPAAGAASTFVQYTYSGATGARSYYVYTPAGYTTTQRVPLIVMLHGCGGNAIDFSNTTQMNSLADTKQFIVAYPQQSSTYNGCWVWTSPANQARGSGEAAIIAGITQTVIAATAQWNVDTSRVYIVGFSAGAGMAVVMAATYPDLYAAMGQSAGYEYKALTNGVVGPYLGSGGPDPILQGRAAFDAMGSRARAVPVITFHGTQDTTVPPINGDQVIRQWMETDRLAEGGGYNASFSVPSATVTGQVPGGHPYTVRSWNDNASNLVEEYWTVTGMAHAWSGGSTTGSYADPGGPSASQGMYTFFMAHTLVAGPPPPLQITSVVAGNIGTNSAAITWQTNNYANSRVDYGPTPPYATASDAAAVTAHSSTLSALTANTTYHYQVTSLDAYGQSSTSADATFTTGAPSVFDVSLSTSANRSAPVPLQGRTVSGTIYVFTSPDTGVTQVRFYLDNPQRTGTPIKTEGLAPWDFAGTAGDGTANPYGTTTLANGPHSITAAIDKSGGGTDVATATFTVSNAAPPPPPPPPPSAFSLQVSAAANRATPAALQGRTVGGTVYVFTSPQSGVTQVRFWLDNTQMTGTPARIENVAPWDFAGTASNGNANPYATTTLANGQHTITAAVDKAGGGTDVLTATFTISN
jgi:poly(hydroxyalkanoate) depolymerase family esterase